MRITTSLLCILLIFTASTALSQEKSADVLDVRADKSSNGSLVAGSLTTISGTYDRIYTMGQVDANCGAETSDSANDGMYYDVYCLQVDDTKPIELVLDASGTDITDTVLTLYCNPFDPMNPDQNVIAFDDDSGVAVLSAITASKQVALEMGQEYWLVISTYGAGMTGNYLIQKSSNVYDCGVVATESTTWGAVKGMYR